MSKIDDLIKKHCPDGVEFKVLGDIATRNKGTAITASKMKTLHSEKAPIRIFAGGQTVADVNEGDIPEKDVTRVPSIIVKSRGHIGFEYYDKPFSHKNELWSYSITDRKINQKFVYYYLITQIDSLQKLARTKSVKLPQLSTPDTDTLVIPIPPLAVQRKVVAILDKFTKLEARQKQYRYYRNALLTFETITENPLRQLIATHCPNGVEFRELGEVGNFVRGNGLQKKDFTKRGVGCIHYGQLYTHYGVYARQTKTFVSPDIAQKAKRAKKGDLVIATTSENDEDLCKAVAWLGDEEVAVSSDACIYQHSLSPKYASYFFTTANFHKQKRPYITGTKVRRVSGDSMSKIKIPIPPLKIQQEIVAILDKFDALVNDLSSGLPAEINARRKQYEHYRNQLLVFKKIA